MATRDDYLTVLEFGKLKQESKGPVSVGGRVAFLIVDHVGARILEGALYSMSHTSEGMRYAVITEEGARWTGVDYSSLAKI